MNRRIDGVSILMVFLTALFISINLFVVVAMKDEKDPGTKDAFPLSNAERQRKHRQSKQGKAKLIYLDDAADKQLKKLSNKTGLTQEQVINWLLHIAIDSDKATKRSGSGPVGP